MKRLSLLTLFLTTFLYPLVSEAIPAFARKYRMSCMTCHAPSMPKLKPYGDEFAGNGFKLDDQEAPRYYTETGDTKLSLIRNFPIAVRMDGFASYNIDNSEKSDLATPYLMKILSGGEISEHFSYYFYFYMSEQGEIAGVEDAYIMYNNLFNTDLDIYIGQFQISDPLFKRELRLELEDYKAYTSQIGISEINLKYDKGIMITYSLPTGTDIIAEVVNGNGIGEARHHVFDKDKFKNYAGRISQSIGKFLRIGIFGLYGKEKMQGDLLTGDNEAIILGPDITLSFSDKLEINGQYLYRTDSKILALPNSGDWLQNLKTRSVMGEVVYSPKGDESNWYLAGLLNYVDSDYNPADYSSATLHGGYLLRRNLRLATEFTYNFTNTNHTFGIFSLGLVSGF